MLAVSSETVEYRQLSAGHTVPAKGPSDSSDAITMADAPGLGSY